VRFYDSRAWQLLEALHEPFGNEERLAIIHRVLDAERAAGYEFGFDEGRKAGVQVEPRNATEGL
jgi:hypothetical protein